MYQHVQKDVSRRIDNMIFHTIRGDRVPALGFGTYQLPGKECSTGVEDAINLGYRHIDTAQAYGNEEDVGRGRTAWAPSW